MKERGLPMRQHELSGILDGSRTQFRRLIKWDSEGPPVGEGIRIRDLVPESDKHWSEEWGWSDADGDRGGSLSIGCPYGQPGDRLWVRETWAIRDCGHRVPLDTFAADWPVKRLMYIATDDAPSETSKGKPYWWNKRASTTMPRWASRLTLEVVAVRVERVQEISMADAKAEGLESAGKNSWWGGRKRGTCKIMRANARMAFVDLWDSINANCGYGWDTNPWVWVVDFKRIENNLNSSLESTGGGQ